MYSEIHRQVLEEIRAKEQEVSNMVKDAELLPGVDSFRTQSALLDLEKGFASLARAVEFAAQAKIKNGPQT